MAVKVNENECPNECPDECQRDDYPLAPEERKNGHIKRRSSLEWAKKMDEAEKILCISTPEGTNSFYEMFSRNSGGKIGGSHLQKNR